MFNTVTKYGIFELSFNGKTEGNPFTDYNIYGEFSGEHECKNITGFYDGEGIYRIRFMPSYEGEYVYKITGTYSTDNKTVEGTFTVIPAKENNHGSVHVADTYHFRYADGTPYYSIGTTCYVWELQSDERINETLQSLSESGFNKIRFCIFPKHYDYNFDEPRSYPYEGTPMDNSVLTEDNFWGYTENTEERNKWDFTRFNPEHFRHIEKCIYKLGELGIQADLIMFHPYDRWGFSTMPADKDDMYVRYIAARFSAYHNVWWALANEYDILKNKTEADWDRFGNILCEHDPYNHLRSIHNCIPFYDHTKPWITHCSIQRQDIYKTTEFTNEWREKYKKPVVIDEMAYEGNIPHFWGNINGQEMVRRFWECALRGGYPGHGETYEKIVDGKKVLWWSHGGRLYGESWKRFNFLYDILKETPGLGLTINPGNEYNGLISIPENEKDAESKSYMIYYYSYMQPSYKKFDLDYEYEVEVIDTWNMTIDNIGVHKGKLRVELPGRQYMAIRFKRIN